MDRKGFTWHLAYDIKNSLMNLGLSENMFNTLEPIFYIVIIVLISFLIAWIAYRVSLMLLRNIMKHKEHTFLSKLMEHNVLRKLTHTIPPLMTNAMLPFIFDKGSLALKYTDIFVSVCFAVTATRAINAIISSVGETAFKNRKFHDRPIKGFIQVAKITVYTITTIIIISIITNKSPLYLIGGLGAFAAVLMLITKDSIMGFVGGFLLLENDMIRIGDWIEMPGAPINGIVTDISLTTVKVRNFDNTIATIPPYTLINDSFINWRGMNESGGRRIARGYTIKSDTIRPCSNELLERAKLLDADFASYVSTELGEAGNKQIDRTTNAGLFRAYAERYLKRHPNVRKDMLIMVRTLTPTANGLPMQFYCFTNTTDWAEYESIQAEIMEHFAYIMPLFDLYPYQNTSARDTVISGMIEADFPLEHIKGIPNGSIK